LTHVAQRIGVFGGAFDPPHRGHVALAQAAVAQLGLCQLLVVPTGQAAHKQRPLSPAVHRLAMCELAFAGVPQVAVDPRETLRSGPSYTVDTLEELQRQYPKARLYLLIGQDQAQALHHWHRASVLPLLATIYVAARPESADPSSPIATSQVESFALQWLHMPSMPHSATGIRYRLAHQQGIETLVTEAVASYIATHHLYQSA
jgi:nicotinate-nucleotide adenylyltransferase